MNMTSDIVLYNRANGQLEHEQVFERRFMDFIYGANPIGRWLERTVFCRTFFSMLYGWIQSRPSSVSKIEPFIQRYNIDTRDLKKSLHEFTSFNDFFCRELQPSARPICTDSERLISPCDGRLLFSTLSDGRVSPVKGRTFTLEALIGNSEISKRWTGGDCLIFRLAPVDLHRFCYIDDGNQSSMQSVNGVLHSVSPLALHAMLPVFTENYREYTVLETEKFGGVLHMDVGALVVGKIKQHKREAAVVRRGQEKGYFEFGGSTIVLLFEPNTIVIDKDIHHHSRMGIETKVRLGEGIGSSISIP